MATTQQTSTVTALESHRGDGDGDGAGATPHAAIAADVAALEQVLRDGHVTFNAVARTWFHLCDETLPTELRERCEQLYPQLLSAFGEPRGGIVTAYFCKHLQIAAALTDIHTAAQLGESPPVAGQERRAPAAGQERRPPAASRRDRWRAMRSERVSASSSAIHVECAMGDPVDAKAREILFRCLDIHYRAIEFLQPKPRKVCLRMIMGVVCSLLGSLDERKANGGAALGSDARELACMNGVLDQARRYYERSAHRQAQIEYFLGMGGGIVLLGGLIAAAATVLALGDLRTSPLLYTALAAGLGAFVSVLSRMTRGQLVLSFESGRTIMRLLGAIRPLLGALFGSAVYVLIAGGMLTIQAPAREKELYFFVGIAFLAGFSERFAQDMIARAPGGDAVAQPGTVAAAAAARRQPAIH